MTPPTLTPPYSCFANPRELFIMLPVQIVAVACITVVYNWLVTQPYVVKKAASTKRGLVLNTRQIRSEVRALLDSVSSLFSRELDVWRSAPSPHATSSTSFHPNSVDAILHEQLEFVSSLSMLAQRHLKTIPANATKSPASLGKLGELNRIAVAPIPRILP